MRSVTPQGLRECACFDVWVMAQARGGTRSPWSDAERHGRVWSKTPQGERQTFIVVWAYGDPEEACGTGGVTGGHADIE